MPIQRFSAIQDGLQDGLILQQRIRNMQLQQAQQELQQRIFDENRQARARDDARLDSDLDLRRQVHGDTLARNAKVDKRQEEEDAYAHLARTLSLAQNPGLIPIGAGDETRRYDFQGVTDRDRLMGVPDSVDVPVESSVEYGGKRFALRSQDEVESRGLATRLRGARAEQEVKNPIVNIPGFGPIRLDLADNAITAVTAGQNRTSRENTAAADRSSRERVASTREAGANARNASSVAATKENSKRNAEGNVLQKAKFLNELTTREGKLMDTVQKLRKDGDAQELASAEAQLGEVRQQKTAAGFTKKATIAQVAAYAKQKGITPAKAKLEFIGSGFWIGN